MSRERQATYMATEKGKATARRASQTYRKRYPEKEKAHRAVYNAVVRGDLTRPDECERCGGNTFRIEGSHDDYSKVLEVEWLCAPCHRTKDGLNGT